MQRKHLACIWIFVGHWKYVLLPIYLYHTSILQFKKYKSPGLLDHWLEDSYKGYIDSIAVGA